MKSIIENLLKLFIKTKAARAQTYFIHVPGCRSYGHRSPNIILRFLISYSIGLILYRIVLGDPFFLTTCIFRLLGPLKLPCTVTCTLVVKNFGLIQNVKMANPIGSIRKYCLKYGLEKTAGLLPAGNSSGNVELEELFPEKETKKIDVMKRLGIVFKGNAKQNELRKRIRNMEDNVETESKKPKKERKETRIRVEDDDKIPESFLKLLGELALDRKDAEILYRSKDQWKFVKSDRKIFCADKGCKFETEMTTDCLMEHCKSAHNWTPRACPYDYCNFECYSPRSYKKHVASHREANSGQSGSIEISCDRGTCGKRFHRILELKRHLNMHDNIVIRCHFCPWTGVKDNLFVEHLNKHYRVRPYLCSLCGSRFYESYAVRRHVQMIHEKIKRVRKCGSCDYKTFVHKDYYNHLETCLKRKL